VLVYYLDNFHPGWRGKIDGKEVPIERANLAFKAISLTQGSIRLNSAISTV